MSRFNSTAVDHSKTINHENGEAYTLNPEMELYKTVCASMLQNTFYEDSNSTLKRIQSLISQCNPEYVARLAVYARKEMNLRTIPLVLTVELAKIHNGDNLISRMTENVIQRADEITELLAFYQISNKRVGTKKLNKLSKQISKGISKAFDKFEEYHFAKYNRPTDVKFRDALFLCHVSPKTPEQKELFEKIITDTLDTPYTWETQLSESGKNGRSKKDVWEELIDSKKVGYMATLRNLRNILEADVSKEHIEKVCNYISNENAVLKSKQLPFRFLSAYKMLKGDSGSYNLFNSKVITSVYTPLILEALESAVIHSIKNIPLNEDDNVLIAADVSGSMWSSVSQKSSIMMYDIGTMMAMMIGHKTKYSITGIFGDIFKTYNFPKNSILSNVSKLHSINGEVGYSTNGYKVVKYANENNQKFDKIMIFTDCELYGGSIRKEWSEYKKNNPNAKLYLFNLNSYGTSPFSEKDNDIYLISGWNEKVFEMMNNLEKGDTVIDIINSIEI